MRSNDSQVLLAESLLSQPESAAVMAELRGAVLRAVKVFDKKEAMHALERYLAALGQTDQKNDVMLAWLMLLGFCLLEYTAEQGIAATENICWIISECRDPELAQECLRRYVLELIEEKERRSEKPARHGSLAVEYIRQNYMQPNLSIKDMTMMLSVSGSYFCNMFKNHTGMTFNDYLTRLRLEKARELLLTTGMKHSEVAAAVGYDDSGYFRQVFKKHTGLTPSGFRLYTKE